MFRIESRHALSPQDVHALRAFSTLCRQDIIKMVAKADSGHPGGSCSIIDVLSVLYATMTHVPAAPDYEKRDRVVFSAGHLSPAAYSVLGEMGYFPVESAIEGFRRSGSPFEGHVSHSVPGIEFTNGSLGKGLSQAAGIAHAAKLKKKENDFHVYAIMGDGEQEEGQVAEARRSITKFGLGNLTVIIDHNSQQLDNPLSIVAPTLDIKKEYLAAGFAVIEIDGHDYHAIHRALMAARSSQQPTLILARTLMGKGVSFMEAAARKNSSEWHGKAPSQEQAAQALGELQVSQDQFALLRKYGWERTDASLLPLDPDKTLLRSMRDNIPAVMLATGEPRVYAPGTKTDNRTAFGAALLDIARLNPGKVVGMTCDLGSSVRMKEFAHEYPKQFIDEGISEQHMVSKAGALSLNGMSVFASTFGAFLSALAADQVRINDINNARVKMVATHTGLNVGEDGMTHQCITDLGFMRGLFNTIIVEPADANQTDKAVRFIANHHGNAYLRMGRTMGLAAMPIILKRDGTAFYDVGYAFEPGRADMIRRGSQGAKCAIIASGAMVAHAVAAADAICAQYYNGKDRVRVIALTTLKPLDESAITLIAAAAKETRCIITVEDHVPETGLGGTISQVLLAGAPGVNVRFSALGPSAYASSGKPEELYAAAGISSDKLIERMVYLLKL